MTDQAFIGSAINMGKATKAGIEAGILVTAIGALAFILVICFTGLPPPFDTVQWTVTCIVLALLLAIFCFWWHNSLTSDKSEETAFTLAMMR